MLKIQYIVSYFLKLYNEFHFFQMNNNIPILINMNGLLLHFYLVVERTSQRMLLSGDLLIPALQANMSMGGIKYFTSHFMLLFSVATVEKDLHFLF